MSKQRTRFGRLANYHSDLPKPKDLGDKKDASEVEDDIFGNFIADEEKEIPTNDLENFSKLLSETIAQKPLPHSTIQIPPPSKAIPILPTTKPKSDQTSSFAPQHPIQQKLHPTARDEPSKEVKALEISEFDYRESDNLYKMLDEPEEPNMPGSSTNASQEEVQSCPQPSHIQSNPVFRGGHPSHYQSSYSTPSPPHSYVEKHRSINNRSPSDKCGGCIIS